MILFEDRAATLLYKVLTHLPNRKFLLPLNVCPIVPDTFLRAKVNFEFIDINLDTLCIDEELALSKMQSDATIDGILFVKTFGIEFDIQPFYKKIKALNKDIFIIDDMCPCIQEFHYDIENSYADMALFSSGYSKYIDIGCGGYAFLKDSFTYPHFDNQSIQSEFSTYKHKILSLIPVMKEHKEQLNAIYRDNLPVNIHLGEKFNTWRFSILVDNKEKILEEICKVEGLFASSHFPQIDYNYTKNPMQNSNAKKIHNRIINLFNDFRFNKEKAYQVVDIINHNLNKD